MNWNGRKVLVTGGASFIGSHLVDALVARRAQVRVVDNLSSGRLEHLEGHIQKGAIEFRNEDLLDPGAVREAVTGIEIIFHLAADHGGRGYVDRHQVECSTNLIMDGLVFRAAFQAGVEKVVYASSGCVYPNHVQANPDLELFLTKIWWVRRTTLIICMAGRNF